MFIARLYRRKSSRPLNAYHQHKVTPGKDSREICFAYCLPPSSRTRTFVFRLPRCHFTLPAHKCSITLRLHAYLSWQALPAGAPQLPVIEIAPGFPNVTLPSGWPKSCLTLTDVLLQLSDAELPPLPFNATDLLERKQYFPKDSSGKV